MPGVLNGGSEVARGNSRFDLRQDRPIAEACWEEVAKRTLDWPKHSTKGEKPLKRAVREKRNVVATMKTPVFETAACVVRPGHARDAASLAKHANDFEIWLNLRDAFPHPYSLANGESWIKRIRDEDPRVTFIIEADGEAAGVIGLRRNPDVERCSAEIGYWVGRVFWGRGIVTAAVRAVSRYGLESLGLERVYALPFARNAASCRVLEKAGFTQEGVLRKAAIKNGEVLDEAMFAITT